MQSLAARSSRRSSNSTVVIRPSPPRSPPLAPRRMAAAGPLSRPSVEAHADRRSGIGGQAVRRQLAGRLVDLEHHQIVGVLVGGDQMPAGRIDLEITGNPPL